MMHSAREMGWNSSSTLTRVAWWVVPTTAAVSLFLSSYMTLATLAYLLLVSGIVVRNERVPHVRLMSTGVALDVLLVLILEVQRSAVGTAIGFTLGWPQMTHIACSLVAVLTYGPVVYLGTKRYSGQASVMQMSLHLRLGMLAFASRTLGFIFMFTMVR